MSQNIDAYKSGQVALQMNFAFIWPGVHADPNVGGDKSGYFPNPADRAVILLSSAAREFPLFPTPTARTQRLSTSSGSHKDRSKRNGGNWAATRAQGCGRGPGFATSQPYVQTFLDSMAIVKDFWPNLRMRRCCFPCRIVSKYVVAGRNGRRGARRSCERLDRSLEDEGNLNPEGRSVAVSRPLFLPCARATHGCIYFLIGKHILCLNQ